MKWLRRFWAWLWNTPPDLPQAALEVDLDKGIFCPCCGTSLDVMKYIPIGSINATVVCSCKEQVDVFPDKTYGWRKAHTQHREKSLA